MVSYSFEGDKRFWTARDEEENKKIFTNSPKSTCVKVPADIKQSSLTNIKNDIEKWPMIHLTRLLRFYAHHRCLWDMSCKDNRNRKMRQAAVIDITTALGTGVTKEEVVQKINILRATYRYEKKRIKQRIRRGLGARTKLKWFALADAFLRHVPKKNQQVEDSSNSDSDLEDTIQFAIDPESLTPLEISAEDYQENEEKPLETENVFSDEPLFYTGALQTDDKGEMNCLNNKSFPIKFETNKNKHGAKQVQNSNEQKSWTFQDSLLFLQLLGNQFTLLDDSLISHASLLKSIAKEMNHSCDSIEKRWHILQKIFKQEKPKILENPQYKPKYKWWPEAEKLFAKLFINTKESCSKADKVENLPTEFINLNETKDQESDYEEYESRLLQNPIPSVAPLSNMNEAMSSLFYEDKDVENLSNTTSTFPEENESAKSTKFVWQGLEEDLLEGKWSLKHSVKFLRLYGVHRCLWDLNDPDYRSRPLRNAALEDIAASMGHGLTAFYVAKKIKIFRITYMQQRKRLLDATERGEKPEILLKWFPLADSFLRPHIGLRSIKSDAKEMPQFDSQYVYANLNLIDPALLTDFRGKGTQNAIDIGNDSDI